MKQGIGRKLAAVILSGMMCINTVFISAAAEETPAETPDSQISEHETKNDNETPAELSPDDPAETPEEELTEAEDSEEIGENEESEQSEDLEESETDETEEESESTENDEINEELKRAPLRAAASYSAYNVTTPENKNKSADELAKLAVNFNGFQWYIIKDDSTAADAGTVTLFAVKEIDDEPTIFDTNTNEYKDSAIRGKLETMAEVSGSFYDVSLALVPVYMTEVAVTDAKIWLLSEWDALNVLPESVRGIDRSWWTRSRGDKSTDGIIIINWDDPPSYQVDVAEKYYLRPAVEIDLSKTVFDEETRTFTVTERPTPIVPVEDYQLWIGGTSVTSENASDIFGDGTAKYDADTRTLTLNGYSYQNSGEDDEGRYDRSAIVWEDPRTLNIVLKGENSFQVHSPEDSTAYGIQAIGGITLSGDGRLDIVASADAISTDRAMTISGGIVSLSSERGYAINTAWPYQTVITGGSLTAVSNLQAIDGPVKNSIAGTGWTNAEGTEGEADIPIRTEGQTLDYKKVQFHPGDKYTDIDDNTFTEPENPSGAPESGGGSENKPTPVIPVPVQRIIPNTTDRGLGRYLTGLLGSTVTAILAAYTLKKWK